MKFSTAAILLAASTLALADDFRVVVGRAENGSTALVFTPEQVKAKVGDRVLFEFHPKNHTVTQSSFAEPCTRQRNTATNELGVDSGFMPVTLDAKDVPVWTIEVRQDTSPICVLQPGQPLQQRYGLCYQCTPGGREDLRGFQGKG